MVTLIIVDHKGDTVYLIAEGIRILHVIVVDEFQQQTLIAKFFSRPDRIAGIENHPQTEARKPQSEE